MKTKIGLLGRIGLIGLLTVACALPVLAQTDTPITNTPPPASGGLQAGLEYIFSLHKDGLELFTNSWEFEFSAGPAVPLKGSVMQDNTFAFFKRVDSFTEVGADLDLLSLGIGGVDLQQVDGHVALRLDWDNLAGVVGAGPLRNVADNRWGGELELGAEYRITKGIGGKVAYYPGYEERGGFVSRIFAGVTIAIGK
jgi:hypothetical protein